MKELYIEIVEELCCELEEAGMSPEAAYDKASELAWDVMRDRLADMVDQADHFREIAEENRLDGRN